MAKKINETALINKILRETGADPLPQGVGPQNLRGPNFQKLPAQIKSKIPPEVRDIVLNVSDTVNAINTVNRSKEALESPGVLDLDKRIAEGNIQRATSQVERFMNIFRDQGLSGEGFGDLFQAFSDAGFQFEETDQGIKTKNFLDLISPPEQPTSPELPPEPPPLEDVIGRTPTDTTGIPGAPGTSPGIPGSPGTVAGGRPGLADALPGASPDNPISRTIAVTDPRNPGQLIEVPVVDRGIPGDIDRQTDQFLLEREGLRQQEQNRRAFEAQRTLRGQRLSELGDLLRAQDEETFGRLRPELAEGAQSAGLLRSSGFGEALARERARLERDTSSQLAQQALSDRELEAQGIANILGQRQQFQAAGLQRQFSLEDFERSARLSRELGASAAPQVGGGKAGGSALQGAATGAAVGGKAGGGGGALTGAGIGAGVGIINDVFGR